ncbi:MAG: hypothetical protein GX989_02530 [Firmicutes bacterium]|nr:hypothetical protein [Bacillota bacterium]
MITHEQIEAVKKLRVLTERLQNLKEKWEKAQPTVCVEPSQLFTKAWQEAEGDPIDVRWAKAYALRLEEQPIAIRDGELVVGSFTSQPKGVYVIAALAPYRVLDMLGKFQIERRLSATSTATIDERDAELLREDAQYWVDYMPPDYIGKALREELGEDHFELMQDRALVFEGPFLKAERQSAFQDMLSAWTGSPHPRVNVINTGLKRIQELAEAEMEDIMDKGVRLSHKSSDAYRKYVFLKAMVLTCKALITFAERHAELARKIAEKETDSSRREELLQIAECCEWVPANPPRNFREALQSLRFMHMALRMEQPGRPENAMGRVDLILYPYYIRDLQEGKITRQEAAELLGCFWLKTAEIETLETIAEWFAPGALLPNCTICGRDKDGKDVSNEISLLVLEVLRQLKIAEPGVYIRYHDGMNPEFIRYALECNRDYGGGNPAFVNDGLGTDRFLDRGVAMEDAVDWCTSGCLGYHADCADHEFGVAHLNLTKIFELTLHNGIDPKTGRQLGLQTGDPATFTALEELYDAFFKQLDYFTEKLRADYFIRRSIDLEHSPQSALVGILHFEDAIRTGLLPQRGGSKYPALFSMEWVGDRGVTDVSDSLAAIKQLVFDEKQVTMAELIEALNADWDGREELRQKCLQAPKYGNDDDYADSIFVHVWNKTQEILQKRPDPFTGLKPFTFKGAAAGHIIHGRAVGATPNGRMAYTPINDGATSPMPGMDVNGPTANINSANKVSVRELRGATHNMKLSKQVLNTAEKLDKAAVLIKTFMAGGGWHLQFNIVSSEELVEARQQPEKHRNLIVRVGGYSAYFVDLPLQLQDEIIARTMHGMA